MHYILANVLLGISLGSLLKIVFWACELVFVCFVQAIYP